MMNENKLFSHKPQLKKRLSNMINDALKSFSLRLNASLNRYSANSKKSALAIFGVATGTICILLLTGRLGQNDFDALIHFDSITRPKGIMQFPDTSLHVPDSLKAQR